MIFLPAHQRRRGGHPGRPRTITMPKPLSPSSGPFRPAFLSASRERAVDHIRWRIARRTPELVIVPRSMTCGDVQSVRVTHLGTPSVPGCGSPEPGTALGRSWRQRLVAAPRPVWYFTRFDNHRAGTGSSACHSCLPRQLDLVSPIYRRQSRRQSHAKFALPDDRALYGLRVREPYARIRHLRRLARIS